MNNIAGNDVRHQPVNLHWQIVDWSTNGESRSMEGTELVIIILSSYHFPSHFLVTLFLLPRTIRAAHLITVQSVELSEK